MDRNEFDNDKTIEPGMLDVEAVRQAETFFKWAERDVAARAEVERQKFEVEVLTSKLALSVREDPSKYGLSKVTEGAIDARVRTDPSYIKACENLLQARKEAALLDQAVAAMEQKKRMIEILVTLHGQQYFAGPSVPHNLVEAWKEHQGKQAERVNERGRQVARRRVHQSHE